MFFPELEKFFKRFVLYSTWQHLIAAKTKAQNSAGHLGIIKTFRSAEANRIWGLSVPFVRRKSTAPLDLTSCRGLGVSVESKERGSIIEGRIQYNQRTE